MKKQKPNYSHRAIMCYEPNDSHETKPQFEQQPCRREHDNIVIIPSRREGKPLDNGQVFECKDLTSLTTPALYTLDLPDNSRLVQLGLQNHPHLFRWFQTKLGQKYLEQQRGIA